MLNKIIARRIKVKLQPIEYTKIENTFLDIVEDLGLTEFPINPFEFAKCAGVELIEYSELPRTLGWLGEAYEDGFSAMVGEDRYCIYYNDYKNDERMRFTLWYELGHICLGHLDGTSATTNARKQQAECNHFARFAQAPMPFVIKARPEGIDDIMNVFGVSFECAEYVCNSYTRMIFHYPATAQRLLTSRITRLLTFDIDECKRRVNAL